MLSERLKEARNRAGISVKAAASAIGVSRVQIWRMESEATSISIDRLIELAQLYDVTPASLLTEDIEPTPPPIAYQRVAEAIIAVEGVIQTMPQRPEPEKIGKAVVEILKLETERIRANPTDQFDPTRYNGILTMLFNFDDDAI